MSDLLQKLKELHSNTLEPSKNTPFSNSKKVSEDSNKYSDFSSKFDELPAFCEHLPFEFKNAMIALKLLHNTPYEFSLSVLLGMANTCVQHLYDVDSYKYGIRPISLYIMIILGTGGSKSTILNELKGPLNDFQKHMWEALKNEDARYMTDLKLYKKKIAQYEKDKDDGLNPNFPEKPSPAETANYINSKFTVNGIIDTLKSQGFASIITAEAGEFFTSHAFQGGKQDNNRAIEMTSSLTKTWDADPLSKVISDERVLLLCRRVNALWMVQEGVIRPVLNNKTFQEQGFIHRILISQIDVFDKPDMSFDNDTLQIEEFARNGLKRYLDKLSILLDIRPTMMADRHFELDPKVITSTHDARVCIADFYNSCKDIGKIGNELEQYEGFSNRLHEHTIRIAATLAAFNNNEKIEITISEAKASIDIMKMFIKHRSNLELGITDTRPELTQGAKAVELWFKNNTDKCVTSAELGRSSVKSLRDISAEQRENILSELLKNNIINAIEQKSINGRVMTKYRFNME